MNESMIFLFGFIGGFIVAVLTFGSFKPRK